MKTISKWLKTPHDREVTGQKLLGAAFLLLFIIGWFHIGIALVIAAILGIPGAILMAWDD